MTIEKTILGIVPGLQATALVGENLKLIPKFNMKQGKRFEMKKPVKKLMKAGIITLVGIGLIKPTAEIINKL